MSDIYKQARKYCNRFLKLDKVMVNSESTIMKGTWTSPYNVTNRYQASLDSNKKGFKMKMARGRFSSYEVYYYRHSYDVRTHSHRDKNFYIINDKIFSHYSTKTVQELRDVSIYDEGLEFQLSTVYNDSELFDYYCCSMLYYDGFRGACRTSVHHSTWKALYENALKINSKTYGR
ncbi:hypothetical protein [Yersinia phage fHe-Yen9-03]|uniref:Uncharacterized protein n=1 Tax=Yersinia phage fHe-Yen9-03 TaxID=2052743 RepID=A0A2C9CZP0_9CAUD|nr:hypothetical protein [Yersinia phage fHe-Yen9-03]